MKKTGHNKFSGVTQVTQTFNLISDESGPLVQATVVEGDKGSFLLQLDYWGKDQNILDNDGYINVRWTKQDLQYMINLINLAEDIISNEQNKENK